MIIQELVAKLGLEIDEGVFSVAEKMLASAQKGLLGIGVAFGAYVGGIQAAIQATRASADHFDKASQAAGINAEVLQELTHAAGLSGVSAEGLQTSMQKLSRTAYDAANGSTEAAESFAAVGVSLRDAKGQIRPVDALLGDIAERLKGMPDGTEKTALAMRLLGRSGATMIPLLNGGRDGLAAMRHEARDLGVVLSEETVKAGAELSDNQERLAAAFTGLRNEIAGPLLKGASDLVIALTSWLKANRKLLAAIIVKPYKMLASTLEWISKNMWAVKLALASATTYILITHLPAIAAAIASAWAWVTSLTAVQVASWAAGLAAGAAGALAAAGWALAAVAIVLAVDEIITTLQGGESYINDLAKKLDELWENPKYDPKKTWLGDVVDFFKTMLYTVTHIGETFAEWGKLIKGEGPVANYLRSQLDNAFGPPPSRDPSNPASAMFSPAAMTPAGSVASSTSKPVVNAPQMSVQQTIQASPGMDEKQLAREASTQLEDWWNNELQQTIPAVAPER